MNHLPNISLVKDAIYEKLEESNNSEGSQKDD